MLNEADLLPVKGIVMIVARKFRIYTVIELYRHVYTIKLDMSRECYNTFNERTNIYKYTVKTANI